MANQSLGGGAPTSPAKTSRRRYPPSAVLAVAGAGLLFAFNMLTGFVFIALMLPLIPVYIAILMGNACLLTTARNYALRVSVAEATGMLRVAQHEQAASKSSFAARTV